MTPPPIKEPDPELAGGFDEISLASLIQVLRARWVVVAVPVVLALIAAVLVVRRELPTYTAQAIIQPRVERSPFEDLPTALGVDRSSADLGSQMQLLQAEVVLRAVADSLGWRLRLWEAAKAHGCCGPTMVVSIGTT